ncbi:MAG TPA: hypothetical protein DIU20_03520, partial [Cryomorphaceae bacterium]|nr:hypothetical protein [Cryomorphaceae bacterium]
MQHKFTQTAALLLAFVFLFPDLLASARAATLIEESFNNLHTPYSGAVLLPALEAEPAPSDEIIPDTRPEKENRTRTAPASLAGIVFHATEEVGYMGDHPSDPMNLAANDVFRISIDGLPQQNPQVYAYLTYRIYGLEDGLSLPKSINGAPAFVSAHPEKKEGWQKVSQAIPLSLLKEGVNEVRFNAPNNLKASVEVRDVEIRLSTEIIQSPALSQVVRPVALPEDFSAMVKETQALEAFVVKDVDMPAIPRNIINVTRNGWGYLVEDAARDTVNITIGVNPAKLMTGNALSEVQLFYFDRQSQSWKASHTALDDIAEGEVGATAPGGTNYFAGLIKTPEMPEASAFMPTAISDIKAANPAAEMSIMQPPSISQTGEASISYPLAIPAGRQGMTPSLNLNYSSDASTGWLGVGWNINVPSVSIDTRWGAPVFDPDAESEVYVLNGQSLTMEGGVKANRYPGNRISALNGIHFFTKTMASYKEVIRHGDGTDNYCWEEITADGTHFFYGTEDGNTLSADAIITDENNDIVTWNLKRVEDKWGNYITYNYTHLNNTTQGDIKSGGKAVLLNNIRYTGDASGEGKYKVEFVTSGNRIDATVSLKSGRKEVDGRRLETIKILYYNTATTTQEIRRFEFQYTEGDFFKTLLSSVEEWRSGKKFYEHNFEYYSEDLTYSSGQTIEVQHFADGILDGIDNGLTAKVLEKLVEVTPGVNQAILPSPISTTLSFGYSVGGSAGLGLAPGLAPNPTKSFTFSGHDRARKTFDYGKTELNDINGDGLPDLIYNKPGVGNIYYPLKLGENGEVYFQGSRKIYHDHNFFSSRSSSRSYGWDFALSPIFSYGQNWNETYSKTTSYTADYNADGILDAVLTSGDQSHVYFGKVGEYGKIFFSSSSELTPNPVKKGVSVTIPEDEEELKDMEVIRIWEAPFEGTIDIDGQAEVIATSDDDVKVGIQLNSSFLTSPNMVSINGTSTTVSASTEVRKGDKILFRCNSKENGYGDLLEWNPSISYTTLTNYSGTTRIDPNGLDYANTNYEDAFLLSAPEGVNFFGDQAIKVTWSPGFNVGSITDSVTLQIVLFKQDTVTGDTATNHYSYVIKPNGATSISPSQFKEFGQTSAPAFLNAINLVPNSSANDLGVINFKAVSTSNIDWKEINWRPEVRLGPVCGVNYENIYPAVHYQTYNRLILMDSPAIAASGAASDDLRTWPEISLSSYADAFTSDELASSNTIEIQGFFVTKTINKLLSKVLVKLDNNGNLSLYEVPGPLQSSLNSVNKGQSAGINSFKRSDLSNAKVFAGFYCSNKRFADFLKDNTTVDIYNLNSSTSVPETADIGFDVFCRIFNELQDYNLHWGQCGWSEASIVAIDTSELHLNRYPSDELDFSDGSTPELADFTSLEEEQLNPKDQKFFTLNALRGENTRGLTYYPHITDTYTSFQELDRWAALSTHIASYGSGAGVAPGKLNETPQIDEPEIVVIPDNYSAFATPLKSKSFTKSESFGASFFMHSETIQRNQYLKEKVSSFIDLNGDRYPDVNNMNNGIQSNLTDPFGGHKNTSEFGSGINALGQSKTIEATNLIAGQYINDDLRFIGIKEKNNTLEIGEAFNEYDWVDINGDGLIDRIDAESNSLWVELNSGKGLLAGYNVSNLRTTSTKNYTYPLANLISSYVGAFDIVDNSFAAGVNITATGNKAQVTYLDFNGDGLNDMLKYNGSSVSLQLNTGTSFQAYGNMDLSEIDDVNFSRQLGISVKGAGGYSFPLFTLLFVHFKGNLKGDGNLNLAANKLESVMRDMNGDGLLDYVKAEDNGDLTVHYCELKKSNLLKKVINPLGGSFTLDYERVGNKYGDYPVAIKIHTTKPKDRMVWDMPQSKWILAYLKVNDGLDIVNSSNDIDGVDSLETWFNYDGGIYSRREREFLGFTRVESRERANRQIAIEDHPKVFLTHVTDYDRPIKNDFNYRKRFEYTRGIPYEEYILRHKETYEEGEFGFEFKYYIDPIEETHYNFEYRLVSQDVESEYFNQVDQVDEDFTVVDLENDELPISEVQTVFPALTDFEIFTFPQLENNQKDKYFAKKFNIKYDGYTNVTEYKSEGSEVPGTPEDRIVDMFISTRYEDTTFSVYYSELLEGESPFDGDSYNENGNRCYLVSVGSFRLDTLCFPASLFEPVVNPCGPEPEPIGSEETFEVVLRKRVVDTTFITERVYPTTYLARITAQMDYFAPVNAAGQTNFLSEHRIYLGTINPSGLKRKSVVEARTSGSQADLAPAQIAQYLADGTTKSIADIVYDNNGNVIQLTGPPNHTNQRFSTYFTYDTEVKQFVKRVANSYGEEICNSYNYKTGKLLRTVDINGNATGYSYDDYERLVGVFAPYAFSSTSYAPTIAFVYHPEGLNPSSSDYRDRVPYALTYHNVNPRDPVNSQDPCWSGTGGTASAACDVECDFSSPNRPAILNPLTTVTFMDGLQRVVQVKKDVSKKNGSANDRYREVSGISTLDYLGRETSVSLSVSEDITTNTLESLNSDRDATLIMKERSYDYASRPISEKTVTEGGGYVTSGYSYLWDQSDKFYLQTNFVSQTKTYLNGWGQTTKVIEDVGGINAT